MRFIYVFQVYHFFSWTRPAQIRSHDVWRCFYDMKFTKFTVEPNGNFKSEMALSTEFTMVYYGSWYCFGTHLLQLDQFKTINPAQKMTQKEIVIAGLYEKRVYNTERRRSY